MKNINGVNSDARGNRQRLDSKGHRRRVPPVPAKRRHHSMAASENSMSSVNNLRHQQRPIGDVAREVAEQCAWGVRESSAPKHTDRLPNAGARRRCDVKLT